MCPSDHWPPTTPPGIPSGVSVSLSLGSPSPLERGEEQGCRCQSESRQTQDLKEALQMAINSSSATFGCVT